MPEHDGSGPRVEAEVDTETDTYHYRVVYDGEEYEHGSVDLELVDQQGLQQRIADAVGSQLALYADAARQEPEEPPTDTAAHTEPTPE